MGLLPIHTAISGSGLEREDGPRVAAEAHGVVGPGSHSIHSSHAEGARFRGRSMRCVDLRHRAHGRRAAGWSNGSGPLSCISDRAVISVVCRYGQSRSPGKPDFNHRDLRRSRLAAAREARLALCGRVGWAPDPGGRAGHDRRCKLNGGLLTIVALLSLGVTSVIDARGRRGAMAAATVVAPALAFALFVFLMPQLHADVPERLQRLGQRWSKLTAGQQARMPDVQLLTVSSRAKAAYAHAYPGFEWRPTQTRLLQCLLSIAGLGVVLSAWGAGVRRKTGSAVPCVLALWAMVVVTGTTLWAPLNWDRYFLQMAPPIAILQAVAIGALLRQVPLRLARVRTAISSSDPGGKGEAGPIDGRKD